MAVTFVSGTGFTQTGTNQITVSANAPTGLADGDALFAAVYARNTPVTAPAGWTLQSSASSTFSGGGTTQYLRVFRKDTVISANSGASYTFSCASIDFDIDRMGVCYSAFRNVDAAGTISATNSNDLNTYSITPSSVSAAIDGSMLLVFVSGIFGTVSSTPTPPTSFTLSSGGPFGSIRLAAAYRAVNAGQSNSGAFVLAAGASGGTHGMGAATILLEPVPPPPSATEGYVAAATMLGSPELLSTLNLGRSSAATPLGAPSIRSVLALGFSAAATPLGAPGFFGVHDFTAGLDTTAPSRFVMDLVTPGGLVRVPISSWQSTLRASDASYTQCVIPAATPWISAIETATSFIISRRTTLASGGSFEYAMSTAPVQTITIDQGARRHTVTLSGYVTAVYSPTATSRDRELQGIRLSSSTGGRRRIQCAIDWLLQPGQRAILDGDPFVVDYISYFCNVFSESMIVGEAEA